MPKSHAELTFPLFELSYILEKYENAGYDRYKNDLNFTV